MSTARSLSTIAVALVLLASMAACTGQSASYKSPAGAAVEVPPDLEILPDVEVPADLEVIPGLIAREGAAEFDSDIM